MDSAQSARNPAPASRNGPLWDDPGNDSQAVGSRDGNRSRTAARSCAGLKDLSLSRLGLPSDDFPALLRFDDGFSKGIDRDVARKEAFQDRPEHEDTRAFKCLLIEGDGDLETPRECDWAGSGEPAK